MDAQNGQTFFLIFLEAGFLTTQTEEMPQETVEVAAGAGSRGQSSQIGHPASQGGIDEGLPESGITSSGR